MEKRDTRKTAALFFGHPEVSIAILPGTGIVSPVLAVLSRKAVFSYKAMV